MQLVLHPVDVSDLRPLWEVDAGQRGAAKGCLRVLGYRAPPRQSLWPVEVTWKNSAVLGSSQRPNY